jgi:hypothetical protein
MADARTLDMEENPSWVLELPDADNIEPPVDTHEQELPFGKLTWQNFERLCLRLAGMDGDAEFCRLYGTEGQEQGGIDIYVRRRSTTKYATWQSKRCKSFSPGQVETAVTEFFAGEWATKSDRFVLCVQASLRSAGNADKIEECAAQLRVPLAHRFGHDLDGIDLGWRRRRGFRLAVAASGHGGGHDQHGNGGKTRTQRPEQVTAVRHKHPPELQLY